MKTRIFLIALLALFTTSAGLQAQEKESEKKAQAQMEKQQAEMEKQQAELEMKIQRMMESQEELRDKARAYSVGTAVVPGSYFFPGGSGSSSSQLSLSKSFDGESKSNEGSFNVDESVRHISLSLNGSVKEGSIKITIQLGNNDIIKDITIDESADIQFTQSIKISEDEKKYYGNWTYLVEAKQAKGQYRLSINTR